HGPGDARFGMRGAPLDTLSGPPMQSPWVPQAGPRPISYFKRFRMEIGLEEAPPAPPLPAGYWYVPWDLVLVEPHAEVLFASFQGEIDAIVFPSLGSRTGCQHLMTEISRKHGFLPTATWLVACEAGYCATVQGVRERNGLGAIQNLGVAPAY